MTYAGFFSSRLPRRKEIITLPQQDTVRAMARRRFFVPEVSNGQAELEGDEAKHLVQVLRVETGQVYEISDNEGVYLAEVEIARKAQV
ncbi:MAG: RNA methyltransferase PUA domain-containing protein, partial [Bryobacteraceae bacterium]|nr:RNA methyltransferase PUA domain-containing protein [Bryobacteraceae bacterium]